HTDSLPSWETPTTIRLSSATSRGSAFGSGAFTLPQPLMNTAALKRQSIRFFILFLHHFITLFPFKIRLLLFFPCLYGRDHDFYLCSLSFSGVDLHPVFRTEIHVDAFINIGQS